MKKLIEFYSGSPQFRIQESTDINAPYYCYYGQAELENDLIDMGQDYQGKRVRTFDKLITVQTDDIVFSLISGRASQVRARHQGYLLTQNYVKLMPSSQLNGKYLIFLLNENANIRRQLQMNLQGSSVQKYTIKQLKELELPPLPPLEKQQLMGEIYFKQLRIQALQQQVAKLQTTIVLNQLKGVK
ncbi:restriction endonuclease subunit S [Volucribacter amazonae]|uniref:Restriction endonuclease subunit M n=1 Tax=Volucribacter amazonae TaxID=256731 RepID=A0A9X4SQ81_9PAST|nr:restriction endonuclease subunit S [Volucribacter amazonae]MDG6894986.1 restriction endonuclease subunit M [Volucribacter amazonae]